MPSYENTIGSIPPGRDELRMTFQEWRDYAFDPHELIFNASAVDGQDFHVPHPIGLSVYILDAIPTDPAKFTVNPVHEFFEQFLANAIFRLKTTRERGERIRDLMLRQIRDKTFIFQDCRDGVCNRLDAVDTWNWYQETPFTLSPRGRGFDCHRHYEALICKSIPIIVGADESLRIKYEGLPVRFVDNYGMLTRGLLEDWYNEILDTEYDFNPLTRSYWQVRRPDVDLMLQSTYWLNKFEKLDHGAYLI